MDGFKALWRHTGYINEAASEIGSNSLINPVILPLPLYFYTLHKHISGTGGWEGGGGSIGSLIWGE